MELYQLRTFTAVAEEGHLTRAAERLNTSQPAVSAQIKALESELGVILFDRQPKGMKLTREGQLLKEKALKILRESDDFLLQAKQLHAEISGRVNFGLNCAYDLRVEEFFTLMADEYPKLEFHLMQSQSSIIVNDVKNNVMDVGYIFGPKHYPELNALPLKTYTLRIAGPKKWQDEVLAADWKRIAEFPWIWTPENCAWRQLISEAFRERELHPTKIAYADDEKVLSNLITAGAGLGLVLEKDEGVVFIDGDFVLWPGAGFPITLSLVYRKNREHDPVIRTVLAGIEKVWGIEETLQSI